MATKNTAKNTTYVALTTQNARLSGWDVILIGAPGESRETIEERASRQICGDQWDQAKDISVDTELKNLVVVSKSQAQRRFPQAWHHVTDPLMVAARLEDEAFQAERQAEAEHGGRCGDRGAALIGAWREQQIAEETKIMQTNDELAQVEIAAILDDNNIAELGDDTGVCVYCEHVVPDETNEPVPNEWDEDEWERLASYHARDCEWVLTRAHNGKTVNGEFRDSYGRTVADFSE